MGSWLCGNMGPREDFFFSVYIFNMGSTRSHSGRQREMDDAEKKEKMEARSP